ncbi:MAG: dehydrogenase [Hyphomicrobiales bacterium]|nr:dehydrogenase [Hyphomicrobiales bacterium]
MRWIAAEELRGACDLSALVDALEAGHRSPGPEVADGLIGPSHARYLIRSAHDGDRLLGSKLITILPDNPERHALPSVQAVIVLFDGQNGVPRAALDATELTWWKTAADSALGASFLARRDARTLLIAGAGGLAPWLVRGHRIVRPGIERVLVWNRTPAGAEALVERLCGEGMPAEAAPDLKGAFRAADIVSTATMAREPILEGRWLKPGTHVDLVGGFSPDTREADDETLRRGKLFVDCRASALDGVGDIVTPLEAGVITQADILGDLFDLAGGTLGGRQSSEEITVYKNAGGAHLDLMVAAALLERLEEGA